MRAMKDRAMGEAMHEGMGDGMHDPMRDGMTTRIGCRDGARGAVDAGRRRVLCVGMAAVAVAVLAACGTPPPAPSQMDLGPSMSWGERAPLARRVELLSVTGTEPLQSTSVAYRLAYVDPFTRRAYRETRWAAPAALLVGTRMRQVAVRAPVTPEGAAQPMVSLTVELEECVQTFSSPTQSEVLVRLSATSEDGQRRGFERVLPGGSDAQGAVRGIAQAVDELTPEVLTWAASLPLAARR